ncbi:DUF1800 family protein [Aquabacterium sp. CECT 9606]|uniref:DUF1800 domain-containing protein n=1 Tax=Aquabacterium sp. CECT 9606 TaxID=2845822 RepID=UPI001E567CD2|nr:DUF1800 domain-containing protein [Aquabacterium sp. CECT 9606]CAH0351561.1 hypothetical protein AQB9606_02223 [Aquabacterium sp. CECT 9606]
MWKRCCLSILASVRSMALAAVATWSMAACGGGGACDGCVVSAPPAEPAQQVTTSELLAQSNGLSTSAPITRQQATRFLTQATFGPTQAEVDHLMAVGYQTWLDEQFAVPMSSTSHVAAWDASNAAIMKIDAGQRASSGEVTSSFWRQAVTGPDQLRQRVALALSEIFVVSTADSCGSNAYSRGAAGYLDMLGRQAFGSYRELLESVALHPVMGCYLSYFQNQKEDLSTGRVPDENFAREVMQLFSIGLYQLNLDGSVKTDARQQPLETYTAADVSDLAKVFTGWGLNCSTGFTASCFFSNPSIPEQFTADMRGFALYHSTAEKSFLGTVVPANLLSTPEADLKAALDTLSSHPNVGPFIGKQLIQRLVTSNPSPAYVARVASAFKASGGSLRTTVSAILLDTEARNTAALNSSTFGKVREPILRFSALLRAMDARSDSGLYLINSTAESLGQSALASPSVFNFFRPGYVKPGSSSAAAKLVTPELQIATETTAAAYVNFMTSFIWAGTGRAGLDNKGTRGDVQLDFNVNPNSPWLARADEPTTLVEELNQRLMYGTMPAALKTEITQAVMAVDFRAKPTPTADQIAGTRKYRLWSALLLTVASPEFQVQK